MRVIASSTKPALARRISASTEPASPSRMTSLAAERPPMDVAMKRLSSGTNPQRCREPSRVRPGPASTTGTSPIAQQRFPWRCWSRRPLSPAGRALVASLSAATHGPRHASFRPRWATVNRITSSCSTTTSATFGRSAALALPRSTVRQWDGTRRSLAPPPHDLPRRRRVVPLIKGCLAMVP